MKNSYDTASASPTTTDIRRRPGDGSAAGESPGDDSIPPASHVPAFDPNESESPHSAPSSSRIFTVAPVPARGDSEPPSPSNVTQCAKIRIFVAGPDPAPLLSLFERDCQHYDLVFSKSSRDCDVNAAIEQSDLVCMPAGQFARAFLAFTDNRRRARQILLCVREEESPDNLELLTTYRGVHITSYDSPPDDLLAYVTSIAFPRQLPRLPILGSVVDISIGGQNNHVLPLIDISNSGCAFAMPAGELACRVLPGRIISLRIRSEDTVLLEQVEAITRHVQLMPSARTASPQYRVGVSFLPRHVAEVEAIDTRIGEPQRVRAILLDRRSISSMALQRLDDGHQAHQPLRLDVNLQDRCLTAVFDTTCDLRRGDVTRGIFEMGGDSFSFITSVLEVSPPSPDISALLGFPRILRVAKRRRAVRFRPRREQPVYVSIASPFVQRSNSRPVLDLTTQGLSFSIQDVSDIFPVGTVLPSFTLQFPDNSELQCKGRVRSISQVNGTLRCGIEIETSSTLAQDRLADAIVHAGQPDIRDVRSAPLHELWAFLESSGFIYPEKRRALEMDAVRSTMARLTAQPNDVFKGTLFVRGTAIHAHVSAIRLYERTWMLQHLAARSFGKQRISFARLINLALLEYLEQKSDIEWIRVTYRPENRAPARLFGALASRVSCPELSRVCIMNCMRSSNPGSDGQLPTEVVVGAPSPDDIAFIESYMLTHRDIFAPQQEDLSGSELHFHSISERYRKIGLERRREILVVSHHGRFAGFALLEISSPGLNLSEVTNAFRIFLLDGCEHDVAEALIRAARRRYLNLGRPHVVALVDDSVVSTFESLGFEHFKRYALWTWHRSLYRQFHDYLLGESR